MSENTIDKAKARAIEIRDQAIFAAPIIAAINRYVSSPNPKLYGLHLSFIARRDGHHLEVGNLAVDLESCVGVTGEFVPDQKVAQETLQKEGEQKPPQETEDKSKSCKKKTTKRRDTSRS